MHYNNHNEGWDRARADLAASAFVAFDWTSRVDLHFARGVCGARRWPDAILDFCCHCHKGLLDVGCVLGRCLEERDSELIGVFLKQREIHEPTRALHLLSFPYRSRGCVDDFLCRQITFVAYE